MADETTPEAPAHLPLEIQKKWQATHASALKQAQQDFPNDAAAARSVALKSANAHVKVGEPADYEAAAKLVSDFQAGTGDGWKIIGHGRRKVKGVEHLSVVTVNGKKCLFPISQPAAKATK